MILKYRAWLKQYDVMVDDVTDMTFEEGNLEFIGRRTSNGVSLQYCADDINLMQSTGLKDKNGKEIFEGDVIAIEVDDTETPINARVFQNSKIGVLMFHVFEDNEDVPMVELLEDNSVAFEIIGNVYENPEMLEVE